MLQAETQAAATKLRPEIQGLRAVAVGTVALFHVWPRLLPGGYVGVDVFFLISGFLITGLLVREAERGGGRIDLIGFYARRARRLLPAATPVLALAAALTPLLLPAPQWLDTATEVIASAFYVENWRLAWQSVDYLAAENAASPVQHYWSLSVEEQFYVFWPVLIIGGLFAARQLRFRPRTVLRGIFAAVVLGSLAASAWLTRTDPASAYFVTHTRVWELGFGGLLALGLPPLGEALRRLLGFAGVAAILAAALLFSPATPFPGTAALLPVLGAALVILSGESRAPVSVFSVLKSRPFQFVGDISYSVYLWHWPLIVFFNHATGKAPGMAPGALILGLSLGLAFLSKVYVEDRFRHPRRGQAGSRQLTLVASLAVVPVLACGATYVLDARMQALVAANPGGYPGAVALASGKPTPAVHVLAPPFTRLRWDQAAVYDNGCQLNFYQSVPVACRFGDAEGSFKVFLIGDSHAANWLPALDQLAKQRGWKLFSYTKSSCPMIPVMLSRARKPFKSCLEWNGQMMRIIRSDKPDLVIFGQMRNFYAYGVEKDQSPLVVRDALVKLWREVEALGPKVVAVADTPAWKENPDDCLTRNPQCSAPLKSLSKLRDPLRDAHALLPQVPLLDFTAYVCPGGRCPAVIGNVIVWRDRHHLTATYSRSMTEVFAKSLDRAIVAKPSAESSISSGSSSSTGTGPF